jgi:hypothetical protein
MRRRIAALLMVVGVMLASAAPAALAQPEDDPGQGSGATDPNPGQTEASRSNHETPPNFKPGAGRRSTEANEHDEGVNTGRGTRNL